MGIKKYIFIYERGQVIVVKSSWEILHQDSKTIKQCTFKICCDFLKKKNKQLTIKQNNVRYGCVCFSLSLILDIAAINCIVLIMIKSTPRPCILAEGIQYNCCILRCVEGSMEGLTNILTPTYETPQHHHSLVVHVLQLFIALLHYVS